jgi:hypothetical protein
VLLYISDRILRIAAHWNGGFMDPRVTDYRSPPAALIVALILRTAYTFQNVGMMETKNEYIFRSVSDLTVYFSYTDVLDVFLTLHHNINLF